MSERTDYGRAKAEVLDAARARVRQVVEQRARWEADHESRAAELLIAVEDLFAEFGVDPAILRLIADVPGLALDALSVADRARRSRGWLPWGAR